MTFDGWTTNLYNMMDAEDYKIIPILYCCGIVFICSFFLLNLIVAVILERYQEVTEQFGKLREQELQ